MTALGGTVSGPSIRAAYGDRAVAGLVSPGPSSCTAACGPVKAARLVAMAHVLCGTADAKHSPRSG